MERSAVFVAAGSWISQPPKLRQGLAQLVVDQFVETGFIWEVYDASTGKGCDNHPFTGWSALIVNIMAELY
jgi:mannosyl-oligosaccharide glucosidase